MRILILMSVWSQNLGDELILKNEIRILQEKYGLETVFDVCSYDPENPFFTEKNIHYHPYFPMGIKKHPLKNIGYFLRFLWLVINADLVMMWWGGIFFDSETGSNPLPQWKFRTKICRLFRTPYEIYRVSIDITQKKNYPTIQQIFQYAVKVSVRDFHSRMFLKKEFTIGSWQYIDPVFFDADIPKSENIYVKKIEAQKWNTSILQWIELDNKIVGIAFRSGFLKNEIQSIEEIIRFITQKWGKILFLPHSFHEENPKANDFVFLQDFCKNDRIRITNNMQETYEIYTQRKIDICLSMRLHSGILCQVYGIPFVSIEYAKKSKWIYV